MCHNVNDATHFTTYDDTFDSSKHYIQLADGRCSNKLAAKRGNAEFVIYDLENNPTKITLTNALLAPTFPTSLFSVCAATEAGAQVTFAKDTAYLTSKNINFNVVKQSQLYFLQTDDNSNKHNFMYNTRTIEEWHTTLGHTNYKDIQQLQQVTREKKIAPSPKKHMNSCQTCKEN